MLITGGTKGIGKACTMDFTSLGARAICTYSNDDKAARDIKHEIELRGRTIRLEKADLCNVRQLARMWQGLDSAR